MDKETDKQREHIFHLIKEGLEDNNANKEFKSMQFIYDIFFLFTLIREN